MAARMNRTHSEETKAKIAAAQRGVPRPYVAAVNRQPGKVAALVGNANAKGRIAPPEERQRLSAARKGKAHLQDCGHCVAIERNKFAHRREFASNHGKTTVLERILARVYPEAVPEVRIGRYWVDRALPESKIALEADGPFHKPFFSNPGDVAKDRALVEKGWTVIRFSEAFLRKVGE